MSEKVNIKNRKASYEYQFIDKYVAGIALLGTEIKSIRNNQANLSDAHCIFVDNELFVRNLHIATYNAGGHTNHEPKRKRKLLLNRQELNKIQSKVKAKGNTVIPIRLFINQKGKAKLEVALAKGKKIYDKRESIKAKDLERQVNQEKISKREA